MAWHCSERHVVSQTTIGPMALSVGHSRSHMRGFGVSVSERLLFSKYDTVFLIFNQTNFTILIIFLHILLDLIIAFPMASSAVNYG